MPQNDQKSTARKWLLNMSPCLIQPVTSLLYDLKHIKYSKFLCISAREVVFVHKCDKSKAMKWLLNMKSC